MSRRARRGRPALRIEVRRPRGQSMNVSSIAVTGAAGLVGQPLLQVLADHPDVTRVVGLDVREPPRRPRGSEFHRVDIAGTRLAPLLEGIDVIVHLAGVVDPIPDEALMARVNVGGTRQVLEAAAAVGAKRIVRVSSATVYGAWANNPTPLSEDVALRPNPKFSPAVQGAEVERLLAEWHRDHPGRGHHDPPRGAGRRSGCRTAARARAPRAPAAAGAGRRAARAGRARRRPRVGARARGDHRSPGCVQRRGRRLARRRGGAGARRAAPPCPRFPRRRS